MRACAGLVAYIVALIVTATLLMLFNDLRHWRIATAGPMKVFSAGCASTSWSSWLLPRPHCGSPL